jgi:predicted ferric reductase/cytochrome b involved in lipid metabolism
MIKIILLLNLIIQTIAVVPCYTSKDVFDKGFTSYKNKVYDITNYVHPAGKKTLLQCKGKPLEDFFDAGKYKFHITSSRDRTFNDLESIYIGDLCTTPTATSPTATSPTAIIQTTTTKNNVTVPFCYTSKIVYDNGFVSYKNKVYDITNYSHPGGIKTLLQSKGRPLESFFDSGEFNFHITTSYDATFNDLSKIYIGELCANSTLPPIPLPDKNIDSTLLYLTITLSVFFLILCFAYFSKYMKCFQENLNLGLLGFISKDLLFFYIIYTIWWITLLALSFVSYDILSRLGIWICLNIAFTLLPVTRNSLWIATLKLSYAKLITVHKYIACLSLISVLTKTIAIFSLYNYTLFYENVSTISATVSSLSILLTTILSIKPIRVNIFELFYYSHKILSILTIISMSFHYIVCLYYVIPSMILYIIDIILRSVNTKKAIYAKIKNYKLSDDSTSYIFVTLCLVNPIKIEPGCYFFICCDNISKLQWHPLSLVYETHGNLVFCVKNMGEKSWSNNLITLENNDNLYTTTNVFLQGPYSHIKLNYDYSYILNIANGIGITPFISILNDIESKKRHAIKKVLLIWIIHDVSFFVPFKQIFEKMINMHFIDLRIYLTKNYENENGFYNFSFINERPKIYNVIENFIQENKIKDKELGVISCGSPSLIRDVYKASVDFKFDLYNETFN